MPFVKRSKFFSIEDWLTEVEPDLRLYAKHHPNNLRFLLFVIEDISRLFHERSLINSHAALESALSVIENELLSADLGEQPTGLIKTTEH